MKILELKSLILSALISFVIIGGGCATSRSNKISPPTKAFAQISSHILIETCEQASPQSCSSATLAHGKASAVVVRHYRDPLSKSERSLILTAGHVCVPVNPAMFGYDPTKDSLTTTTFSRKIVLMDYAGNIYDDVNIIIYDMGGDLCLMESERMPYSIPIKLSPRPPENGERVLNIAAPLGIIHPPAVLIEEGFYVGECRAPRCPTEISAWYSDINAAPGSSGSPIFISIGDKWMLVGMIHSVHSGFPSAPYSATLQQMRDFLTINFNSYIERRRRAATAAQE